MQSNINRQNVSRYFRSHHFSWSSRTFGSWGISSLEKTRAMLSKTLSLNITRPSLQLSYILKYLESLYAKCQGNLQNNSWILIYTEANIYFNSWTKFSLNNRQPSKLLWFFLFLPFFRFRLRTIRTDSDHSNSPYAWLTRIDRKIFLSLWAINPIRM